MAPPSPRWLLLLPLLLLVPAALVQAACSTTLLPDPCGLPADNCGVCTDGEVPDPENCRGFYLCGFDPPLTCDPGEVFAVNDTYYGCVKGDSCEECSTGSSQSCTYECPDTLPDPPNIPHPTDCGTFYTCENTGTINEITDSGTCPAETPFFDGSNCQEDETRCCHCHPYCEKLVTAGILVADPLDCRKYYLCTDVDLGTTPTYSGKCDDGEYFDSVLGECSATASCVRTQCINVLGGDGCITPFTCLTEGTFAKCPNQCTPEYYECATATVDYQEAVECTPGTVFNPDTHTCVNPSECPY